MKIKIRASPRKRSRRRSRDPVGTVGSPDVSGGERTTPCDRTSSCSGLRRRLIGGWTAVMLGPLGQHHENACPPVANQIQFDTQDYAADKNFHPNLPKEPALPALSSRINQDRAVRRKMPRSCVEFPRETRRAPARSTSSRPYRS